MSAKDISTLTDMWLTAFVIYLYGADALVGMDITTNEFNRNLITYIVNVPECDLQILQEQYQMKDEATPVIPKGFVEAYQFILKIQRDVYKRDDKTWRSDRWVRGEVD